MAKVGIACDNYKIDRFDKELIEQGFSIFEKAALTKAVSIITILCDESDIPKIHSICKKIEIHFKRSN